MAAGAVSMTAPEAATGRQTATAGADGRTINHAKQGSQGAPSSAGGRLHGWPARPGRRRQLNRRGLHRGRGRLHDQSAQGMQLHGSGPDR